MLSDKTKLTAKDILEKEFKTGVRGYKQEEVDQFLDLVIKDYEVFHQEIESLQQENMKLKKQLEEQQKQIEDLQRTDAMKDETIVRLQAEIQKLKNQ